MIIQKKKPAILLGIALVFCLAFTGLTDAKPPGQQQTPEQMQTPKKTQKLKKTRTPKKTRTLEEAQDNEILIQGQTVGPDGKPMPNVRLFFSLDVFSSDDNTIVSNAYGMFWYYCAEKDFSQLSVTAISEDENMCAYLGFLKDLEMSEAPYRLILPLFPKREKFRAITGTVVDATGRPVEGAAVGGAGEGQYSFAVGKTDAEGKFRFFFPENAPMFQVFAIKPGDGFTYVVTEEQFAWERKREGKTSSEKISNGPFRLVLNESQTVEVKVVDEQGNPIPDAKVCPTIAEEMQVPILKFVFQPHDFLSSVFYPQTGENGIAKFDWIPANVFQDISFAVEAPKKPVALPDGTFRLFGDSGGTSRFYSDSGSKRWDQQERLVTITLFQGAKVNLKIRKPDGTPAAHYGIITDWDTKNNWAKGKRFMTDEKGEAEIFANAGDRFDVFSWHAGQEDNLVFPAIRGFDVGDGGSEKTLGIQLQPGTKLLGTVYGTDGRPLAWKEREEYGVFIKQIGFERFTFQEILPFSSRMAMTGRTSGAGNIAQASFQASLPPGEFEISVVEQSDRPRGECLGVEQRIKVTDQKEIKLELHLKPLPPEK